MNPDSKWRCTVPYLGRVDGVIISFNKAESDTTTPERWIRAVRERSENVPIVVCGVTGLTGRWESTTDDEFRTVCENARVEYFTVDLDANNGQLEEMVEALIDKTNVRNTNN